MPAASDPRSVTPSGPPATSRARASWLRRLSPGQRRCLRISVLAALWSRVLVWEAGMIAARVFGLAQQPSAYNPSNLQPAGRSLGALLTFPVIRWDGDWYLAIAGHGYALSSGSPPPRTNFFPLYPSIVGGLGWLGLPLVIAAVVVSIAFLILALYALARLVELELGSAHPWAHPDAMRLTVVALALSPVAFFFSAAYAESLYLALSVGAFLCARRGWWARAGVFAGLASATRGPGVLLALPLLWLYFYGPREDRVPDRGVDDVGWRPRYRPRWELGWLALAPAGMLAYMAYLALAGADPVAFVVTQRDVWHHSFSLPWTTVWHGATAAWSDLRGIVTGDSHPTLFGTYLGASVDTGWENLLPFLALVMA
ncbi:MAG: mannosyltransferase family protein, partial [Solirubrobacteraceae bacterium]